MAMDPDHCMTEPAIKYDLMQNGQALNAFLFTVQDGPVSVEVKEDMQVILAYDDEGAMNELRKAYLHLGPGKQLSVRKRGQIPVENIVKALNIPVNGTATVPQQVAVEQQPRPTKEHTEREFVYGMMFVADRYVENTRDKASIKRIMGKILKRYESDKPTASTEKSIT